MIQHWKYILFVAIITGCRKPYVPPVIASANTYLVVEGIINPGPDSTIIKLSHTVNISSKVTTNPVSGAALTVESDGNTTYPLTETVNGTYVSPGLNLNIANKYRLRIKTSNGKEYLSDLEQALVTPPIDSIGFNFITTPETGIQVYVNTHDPNNQIRYYRWDYDENWEFHSKYVSLFISDGTQLLERQPSQQVAICYTNDVSNTITLGSSEKLQRDLIYQNPIVFIPSSSEKIEARYTILLREYAITSNAYIFYTNLKKNTEQLGSIFDAEPVEIHGNIHCITDPSEPVIGYLGVSTISSKRMFISSSQLPRWEPSYPYSCNLDTATAKNKEIVNLILFPDLYLATDPLGSILSPSGYLFTSRECADCTIRGTKIPPPYWK